MHNKVFFILAFFGVFIWQGATAQDTVRIDAASLTTKYLRPGTTQYFVYFKKGADSSRFNFSIWTRTVEETNYNGKEAIRISQNWESSDGLYHTANSVADKKTLQPLFHHVWWKGRGSTAFDYSKKEAMVNDTVVTSTDTARTKKAIYSSFQSSLDGYFLNWHTDLEMFSVLPYKDNRTFLINFYDPGFSKPNFEAYTVSGSAKLKDMGGKEIDCWLLKHKSNQTIETFWIDKVTHTVFKLEDNNNGRFRYKVKLGLLD